MIVMPNEKETVLVMPASLDIDSVPELWTDIAHLPPQTPLIVDFSRVEHLDSAGASLSSLISRRFPSSRFIHIGEREDRLLKMLSRSQPQSSSKPERVQIGFLASLGAWAYQLISSLTSMLSLIADSISHIISFLLHRRGVQKGDFTQQLYLMGYKSLSITSIISLLVGLTISLTTAAQLRLLGGDIYLPTIAGFAMIKELVPIMTGIILAGKIGAAITAEIATMKVMEEIDALETMGIDPVRFLMVPRLTAMTVSIPLLLICADFISILGCILVGEMYSSIPANVFIKEMLAVIDLGDILLATIKTMTFGWAVVLVSGSTGLRASGGAEGVGLATTNAVLVSISSIIVIDCIFAMIIYF